MVYKKSISPVRWDVPNVPKSMSDRWNVPKSTYLWKVPNSRYWEHTQNQENDDYEK